jgi:oxygen-independent coproporphyrinogen-3 oxidase
LEEEYVRALRDEIACAWTPETVYLGGGTPSSMDAGDLQSILEKIPGRPWREATMECAPGTLTREKLTAWRDAGLNRLSLGVQSFIDAELRRTGRRHTAAVVDADVALMRQSGFANFNLDLIAGLPQQTGASWEESLDWIERLAPPHVSVYMLEVDEDSNLGNEILLGGKRYSAMDTPSEEAMGNFYERAVERLAQMGIERYEISNFARAGYESAHNLKYWKREPYLGFGADAHSFDAGKRWQNVEAPGEYVERWREGRSLRESSTDADAREEKFFVGLRLLRGVVPDEAEWRHFEQPISRFLRDGLLERQGDVLRLTARGVMLSNEVFQEFLTT